MLKLFVKKIIKRQNVTVFLIVMCIYIWKAFDNISVNHHGRI